MKVYQNIRKNGRWENFDMIEIEKYPCNDANEGRMRERYWFEELNAKLNYRYPFRTKQEYKDSTKEKRRYIIRNITLTTKKTRNSEKNIQRKKCGKNETILQTILFRP